MTDLPPPPATGPIREWTPGIAGGQLKPTHLLLHHDRVEATRKRMMRVESTTIRLDQIARVEMTSRASLHTITIESTGGALIEIVGLSRGDAEEAQAMITAARTPTQAAVPAQNDSDLSVQLARLAELHATGVLDDGEFAAAKARLIGQ